MKITDEFLVKGYYRNYDGMHLLKHALHNTCPDMMKSIGKDENGNEIKVRDSLAFGIAVYPCLYALCLLYHVPRDEAVFNLVTGYERIVKDTSFEGIEKFLVNT